MIQYIVAELQTHSLASLWCDAKLDLTYFYKRRGFKMQDKQFLKHDRPYIKVSVSLMDLN